MKPFEEEADEYHEHPEYEHRTIDKVAYEEEGTISSESGDEADDGERAIMQTFDDDLKEGLARQLKDTETEAERSPLKEEQPLEDSPREELPEGGTQVVKSLEDKPSKEPMHEVEHAEEEK